MQAVVFLPVFLVSRVVFVVHDFEIAAGADGEPHFLDALCDYGWAADEDRRGQFGRHNLLGGVQHALVFAFGQHHAFERLASLGEDGFHEQAGLINKLVQFFFVSGEIGNRAGGYAGIHGGFGHGGRHAGDQARIEGFGNQVFGAEFQLGAGVGSGDFVVLLGHGQIGNGAHGGQLHFFVDGGGTHIECAAEDEGEAENVVHLVGEVGTAGADNHIGAGGFGFRRPNFGLRVGHGQHDG